MLVVAVEACFFQSCISFSHSSDLDFHSMNRKRRNFFIKTLHQGEKASNRKLSRKPNTSTSQVSFRFQGQASELTQNKTIISQFKHAYPQREGTNKLKTSDKHGKLS